MAGAATWPGRSQREPSRGEPGWSIRKPIADWLRREGAASTGLRVLDVGCGSKPYRPFFAGAAEYVGLDVPGNPDADVHGFVEDMPLEDASFDLVLCIQVLEHVEDPAAAVRELHRVTKPGGRVLASTHGVMVYHPNPNDYWRWTHTGLGRLFATNGDWSSLDVTPGAGSASGLGLLLARFDPSAREAVARAFRRPAGDRGGEHDRRHPRRTRPPAPCARSRRDVRELPRDGGALVTRVLVTGGGGFIGSNLVRALLDGGDDVRVLDNFSTGNRDNLEGLDVEIVEGELRSYERVHNAVRGVEVVFHLGALGSVPRSVQDPLTSSAVNIEGTLNVLLAARDEGVRRVVYSSSSSVYGTRRDLPVTEETPPDPSRRTASRSSRPSATASASRASTRASRASCCGTSTSSAHGRARSRSTRPRSRSS